MHTETHGKQLSAAHMTVLAFSQSERDHGSADLAHEPGVWWLAHQTHTLPHVANQRIGRLCAPTWSPDQIKVKVGWEYVTQYAVDYINTQGAGLY